MAVYKRSYKPYQGEQTSHRARFLVISRYALETLFQSRLLIAFLVACYAFPIFCGFAIYLHHNLSALEAMRIGANDLIPINNEFFSIFLSVQSVFAFILTAYMGPGLVSPDLTNNALALYLCRPISRAGYVIGKMAVLWLPLSFITWIPGLILFALQAGLDGEGWGWANARLAWAVFAGSWIWILILSLLAVAASSWLRWRVAASAALFATFFLSAALSEVVREVMHTNVGHLINLGHLIGTVQARMFNINARRTMLGELFNVRRGDEYPLWAAYAMLALIGAACVFLLDRRLRAREVVR